MPTPRPFAFPDAARPFRPAAARARGRAGAARTWPRIGTAILLLALPTTVHAFGDMDCLSSSVCRAGACATEVATIELRFDWSAQQVSVAAPFVEAEMAMLAPDLDLALFGFGNDTAEFTLQGDGDDFVMTYARADGDLTFTALCAALTAA